MIQPVNIVVAFDKNYQNMAEVLLKSLFYYHKNQNIHAFCLSTERFDEQFKSYITHYIAQNHDTWDITFLYRDLTQEYLQDKNYISKATYLRYYIEDLFKLGQGNRWLYLDVDMLVVQDILQPFDLPEFNDYALAAVSDVYVNKNRHHVAQISGTDYFNAGVLYINADHWQGSKQKLLALTQQQGHQFLYGDQDALNMLFKDAWLKLPVSYNTQSDVQESNHNQANLRARILHFTGELKPVHANNDDYINLSRYRYYQQLTWEHILKTQSVAVVTSTIGRAELERAIISVQQQSYSCQHYVFVDGEQYFAQVKPLEEKYPQVIFTYLPINTGADGWTNSHINAIAPFLIKQDIICYLDDDNWYEPHHVQSIVEAFTSYENIDVAYGLRRLFDDQENYICDDNLESLGFYTIEKIYYRLEFNGVVDNLKAFTHRGFLVDTNCLAMRVQTAREFAQFWTHSKQNDAYVWQQCLRHNKRIIATAQRTVNYVLDFKNYTIREDTYQRFNVTDEQKLDFHKIVHQAHNNAAIKQSPNCAWQKRNIYIDGQVVLLDEEM